MVQSHAAGQSPLGEEAQLRDDAFIDLLDGVVIVSVVVLLIQNPANLTSPNPGVEEGRKYSVYS
jgi:hypothetical protein